MTRSARAQKGTRPLSGPAPRPRNPVKIIGGSECESNAPATGSLPPAGFEDREPHRGPFASKPCVTFVFGPPVSAATLSLNAK